MKEHLKKEAEKAKMMKWIMISMAALAIGTLTYRFRKSIFALT